MSKHPYLHGNRAPLEEELCLTSCMFSGVVPRELYGGMYVRNGSNPVSAVNEDPSRDYHLFDGDGLLSGVYFAINDEGLVSPFFTSRFIRTDVFINTAKFSLRNPLLPSISTFVDPATSLLTMILAIMRTLLVFLFSLLTHTPLKRISVANTAVMWWDGRALATCESGPPMRISLPDLGTEGWWIFGAHLEGAEALDARSSARKPWAQDTNQEDYGVSRRGGLRGFFDEWTTAHPHVDPVTNEFVAYHSSFVPPYLHYSVLPPTSKPSCSNIIPRPKIISAPIPLPSPRMMHDFGVSLHHTIILDLPLSLDPLALTRGKPMLQYTPAERCRFGVFPRHNPELIRWYNLERSCLIFHTANTWTDEDPQKASIFTAVNLLACRMSGDSLIWAAGNIQPPGIKDEEDECLLYYYRLSLTSDKNLPTHAFPLLSIPFEFPTLPQSHSMHAAKYIYGCSMTDGTFSSALDSGAKINCLVKVDVEALVAEGLKRQGSEGERSDAVDMRNVREIIAQQQQLDPGEQSDDLVQLFCLPEGWYAQEVSFVPRQDATSEDDGWLLTYVFDESQLLPTGIAPRTSCSELWIIDARSMQHVVARIYLPQRVPYGLHGTFFSEAQIAAQRPSEGLRE